MTNVSKMRGIPMDTMTNEEFRKLLESLASIEEGEFVRPEGEDESPNRFAHKFEMQAGNKRVGIDYKGRLFIEGRHVNIEADLTPAQKQELASALTTATESLEEMDMPHMAEVDNEMAFSMIKNGRWDLETFEEWLSARNEAFDPYDKDDEDWRDTRAEIDQDMSNARQRGE